MDRKGKKAMKRIIASFMTVLLCFGMTGCWRWQEPGIAGVCNTYGCENMQVIHRNVVQDYCFNCRDPR